jgi:equilibrative nucleoside transporter 1/2/3
MFLAAAPYFYTRFQSDDWTRLHYQPSILSVSTVTNLGTAYILAKLQKNASYTWRITLSLFINCAVFTVLAFSAIFFTDGSARAYFGFLMVMVFGASLATGINQNGVFAYVSSFGRDEYMQAIMSGQGVAGVLPCIVQIFSVLAVPSNGDSVDQDPSMPQTNSSRSAFVYFITSTAVSVIALLGFLYLLRNQPQSRRKVTRADDESIVDEHDHSKSVSLWTLFVKLRFLAFAVFMCFLISMVFPVYTAEIQSVNDATSSRIYDSSVFVPLAFLFWNLGDLAGRMGVAIPGVSLGTYPQVAAIVAIARVMFIPMYQLCNINGKGAAIKSDIFYLAVQFLFGATNGYLGTSCMIGANHWVVADERPAAGGFMSMVLVGGLAAGSLLSFSVAST